MTLREELDEAIARAIWSKKGGPNFSGVNPTAMWEISVKEAKAARIAALSFIAARGLKVVPKVATSKMGFAYFGHIDKPLAAYAAMLAVAPDLFAEADDGEG